MEVAGHENREVANSGVDMRFWLWLAPPAHRVAEPLRPGVAQAGSVRLISAASQHDINRSSNLSSDDGKSGIQIPSKQYAFLHFASLPVSIAVQFRSFLALGALMVRPTPAQ